MKLKLFKVWEEKKGGLMGSIFSNPPNVAEFVPLEKLTFNLCLAELMKRDTPLTNIAMVDLFEITVQKNERLRYLDAYQNDPHAPKLTYRARVKRAELEAEKKNISLWVLYAQRDKQA